MTTVESRVGQAREAFVLMGSLVVDQQRRNRVRDTTGLAFGRVRALRRIAAADGITQRELADRISSDPANTTVLVDDLCRRGLAYREPHPTDRRAKVVRATEEGSALARQAEETLTEPPAGLLALSADELATLTALLQRVCDVSHNAE